MYGYCSSNIYDFIFNSAGCSRLEALLVVDCGGVGWKHICIILHYILYSFMEYKQSCNSLTHIIVIRHITIEKHCCTFSRLLGIRVHFVTPFQAGTLIKKEIKFSSYLRKFRRDRLQSHIWLTASSYMIKCLRISSYIRKPFLIYDFATANHLNFLIYEKNFVFFFSVYILPTQLPYNWSVG